MKHALKGIYTFFSEGHNAKIQFAAAILVIIAGIYFELNSSEWLWIALAIALVFIAEMINTSIELLCDLLMPEYHVKAGKLKDIAAGAVLVTVIFALVVAGIVFGNRIVLQ